jgi:hypothetical protein
MFPFPVNHCRTKKHTSCWNSCTQMIISYEWHCTDCQKHHLLELLHWNCWRINWDLAQNSSLSGTLGFFETNYSVKYPSFFMLTKLTKVCGMLPTKKCSCISKYSRTKHCPRLDRMLPNNLLFEMLILFKLMRLPTSSGTSSQITVRQVKFIEQISFECFAWYTPI